MGKKTGLIKGIELGWKLVMTPIGCIIGAGCACVILVFLIGLISAVLKNF